MRLKLQIAAVPFSVELPDGAVASSLAEAWREFPTQSQLPPLVVRFRTDHRPVPTGVRTMPLVDGESIRGAGFEATVSDDHADVLGADERFGVESVLKLLLARELLPRGGVLVHGVALCAGVAAAVLLGESGAGKSTLGALGAGSGLQLLSDELVALVDGKACGTPWNTGRGASATLKLLGTLGWAATPRLEPVPPADFLPLILSNTLLPDDRPETRAAVFSRVSRLLVEHSPQRFFFPPDAGAAAFLSARLR